MDCGIIVSNFALKSQILLSQGNHGSSHSPAERNETIIKNRWYVVFQTSKSRQSSLCLSSSTNQWDRCRATGMVARTTTGSPPRSCLKPGGGGGGCGLEPAGLNSDCTHFTKLSLNNSIFPISSITKSRLPLALEGTIDQENLVLKIDSDWLYGLTFMFWWQLQSWEC